MVFRIASILTRKKDRFSAYLTSITVMAALCLSACGSHEDASAQANNKSALSAENESPKSVKPDAVKTKAGSSEAGLQIFERSNCAMCHPGGNNTMDPGHPIKGQEFASRYADDALLESTIRKGFPNVGMPAFSKKQIDDQEMKDLIAYVRTLTPAIHSSNIPNSKAAPTTKNVKPNSSAKSTQWWLSENLLQPWSWLHTVQAFFRWVKEADESVGTHLTHAAFLI